MLATLNASQRANYLAPLKRFYDKAGGSLPEVNFLHGTEMPEPYRHLLVHHSDMTPRLRAFHESELILDVLEHDLSEPVLIREVLLRRKDDRQIVEFGAIRIELNKLPDSIAQPVRLGQRPLGGILESERFEHLSAPRGYFSVEADQLIADTLSTYVGKELYGRCNVLAVPDGDVFAEIVEILPLSEDSKSTDKA